MQVWDSPMYSAALASRLVGLTPGRVRRWLQGYKFSTSDNTSGRTRTKRMAPVIHRENTADSNYASFLDLIDLLFVKKFLDHGISLQRLRKALEEAERLIGSGHHFAQRNFFTNGRKIYLQVKDDSENLIELLAGGQWVIAPIIKQLALQIDFDNLTGFAKRWYPRGQEGRIVVDPQISFGKPTIMGRGIATSNVYDLFQAEKEDLEGVCSWLDLEEEEVVAAVKYERLLAAA